MMRFNEAEPEALIAELRHGVELGRRQAAHLRNVLRVLLDRYNLADEIRNLPTDHLERLGLVPEEVAALRDVLAPLRRFSWLEGYRVAGCARPLSRSGVEALAAEGIRTLVTLTEDPLPEHWLAGLGMDVAHVPMADLLAAESHQLRQAVAAIERGLEGDRAVAVHCAAGIGRTGTVLAAFLVARGLSTDKAIETLSRLRPASHVSAENRVALARFAREITSSGPGADG